MKEEATVQTLRLANGAVVAWREYGDPAGRPLFFFNGWPGSGAQGYFLHQAGLEHHVRIISPDRPGFGKSSFQRGRTFLDWPPAIAAIADSLSLTRFHVMGMSGGGPYALACAWAIPDRIPAVCICCGAVPTHTVEARRGLHPAYRFMLRINDFFPPLMRGILFPMCLLGRVPLPWPAVKWMMRRGLKARDLETMSNPEYFALFQPSFAGAMRSGSGALYHDGRLYAKPWPFEVSEIRIPVRIWHGQQDENFKIDQARLLASRIPGAQFFELEEGHYSLPLLHGSTMIQDLMEIEP